MGLTRLVAVFGGHSVVPAGVSGTFQAWVVDPGVPGGLASSHGVQITVLP